VSPHSQEVPVDATDQRFRQTGVPTITLEGDAEAIIDADSYR
jgi:hypothetical protein